MFKPAYFVLESSHHFAEFYRIKKNRINNIDDLQDAPRFQE